MYKPNGILTMTTYNNKTHLEVEQEFAIKQNKQFTEFVNSHIFKELIKKINEDLLKAYYNYHV